MPALGLQLLEELDASSLGDGASPTEQSGALAPHDEASGEALPQQDAWTAAAWKDAEGVAEAADGDSWLGEHVLSDQPNPTSTDVSRQPDHDDAPARQTPAHAEVVQHAHRPHPGFGNNGAAPAAARCSAPPPSELLDPNDPEVLAKLEHLDDLVYDAIGGRVEAIGELQEYWPRVREELGDDLLVESQEQYLRYALATWTESIEPDALRDPTRAIHSLEVLCLLFNEQ